MNAGRASPRLSETRLQQTLDRLGYVCLELLDPGSVSRLLACYDEIVPTAPEGFTATLLAADEQVRRTAHNHVIAEISAPLGRHVDNARIVNGGFAVRSAASGVEDMPLHQDWSFVDERVARSLGLWIPLIDVDDMTGCLQVVAGSHASDHPPRVPGSAFAYRAIEAEVRQRYLRSLPLRSGQAVIFDQRLFHCSASNLSGHPRPAAAAVLLPEGEPLRLCAYDSNRQVELRRVPDDYYLTTSPNLAGGW